VTKLSVILGVNGDVDAILLREAKANSLIPAVGGEYVEE